MPVWRPWPYAANAIVQWSWSPGTVFIWIIFRYPMDQTVIPELTKWVLDIDALQRHPSTSQWLDAYTLLLTRIGIVGLPTTVKVTYLGPDPNLRTTWDKQWEPWGPILGYRAMGAPYTGTKTHSAAGPKDNVDVADIGILFIDCSANDVTIGGFIGGVNGQVLRIAKTCTAAHDVTMEHEEGTGNQDMHLHAGGDETLRGEYGGWVLVCDGSAWYDISHAKHV